MVNDTRNWIDHLSDFVWGYNHEIHSTIGNTPMKVFEGKIKLEKLKSSGRLNNHFPPQKFKIDDEVRFEKELNTFDKKLFVPRYSGTSHKIIKFSRGKYLLSNGRSYYPEQLVESYDSSKIENIFEKKKKKIQKKGKHKRSMEKEFGEKLEKIESKQIPKSKRVIRKPRYLSEYL
jgi:hypothetical protein